MGLRSKSLRALKRKAAKKAAKEAKRALYKSYAEKGRRGKRSEAQTIPPNHATNNCGNVACRKCHPGPHNIPPGERLKLLVAESKQGK